MSGPSIQPLTEIRWGWMSPRDGRPQPQLETFKTADEALKAMQLRQASDCDWTVEDFADHGFHLARVKVTIEALAVLSDVTPSR